MKRFAKVAAALGALAVAVIVPAVPASSAGTGPIGYTIIRTDGGCDLATLDLTTGELTDLPAATAPEACVADLAADSEGAVWGVIDANVNNTKTFTPTAVAQSQVYLVAFDAAGTPSLSPIFFDDIADGASLENGGIAFGPAGTYIQAYLGASNTSCDAGIAVCLLTYDPETGLATPIGGSGLEERSLYTLTDCASGQYTLMDDEGPVLARSNRTTGEVTGGSSVDDGISGMDCAPGGSTLYAINSALVPLGSGPAATGASVGTLDPTTGQFSAVAAVSDPEAFLELLAVPGTRVAPTTTTTIDVANANAVAPAFTG